MFSVSVIRRASDCGIPAGDFRAGEVNTVDSTINLPAR